MGARGARLSFRVRDPSLLGTALRRCYDPSARRASAGAVQSGRTLVALLGRGNSGMRKFMITIRSAVCVALLGASTLSTAPANAQDIFGNFFRLFSAPAQRAPVYEHQHAPRVVPPRNMSRLVFRLSPTLVEFAFP